MENAVDNDRNRRASDFMLDNVRVRSNAATSSGAYSRTCRAPLCACARAHDGDKYIILCTDPVRRIPSSTHVLPLVNDAHMRG